MQSDIETYLEVANEATAKRISERIGLPQLEVAKELNRMHADGVIEREKRKGGGNEYVYWLARGKAGAMPAPAPAPAEASVAAVEPVSAELQSSEPAVDMAAFERLAGQTRELLDALGLPATMTEAIAAARVMVELAKATAIERDELKAENESNKASAARWKLNCAKLEQRIDELTLGPVGSNSPLFVTVGRYAKPQRHDSLEKAQKRGQRLVRGEKESEVLVLEPIGRVVRGTEWQPRR